MSRYVRSSPHFFRPVGRALLAGVAVLLLLAWLVPAPLETPADPAHAPNPAKSAWFLLWIQELVSHGTASSTWRSRSRSLLVSLPWLPLRQLENARWLPPEHRWLALVVLLAAALVLALTVTGLFFRGPDWRLVAAVLIAAAALLAAACSAAASARPLRSRAAPAAPRATPSTTRATARAPTATAAAPTAARKELAHERLLRGRAAQFRLASGAAPAEGGRLVEALACRRCHTIAGTGNRLASQLDRVVWQREQDALVASIREPVEGMPPFGLDAPRAESIVSFLLRSGDPHATEDAYRVRFERRASVSGGGGVPTTVFERQCGPCHRVLTPAGLLGTGTAGANLSGLFTPFYPKTAPRDGGRPPRKPHGRGRRSPTGSAILARRARAPPCRRSRWTTPSLQRLLGELGAPSR